MSNAALMVDLSSNNPLPNLKKHWKAGYRVLALKATEGSAYTWDQHGRLADQWHKLGGYVWHYHFARSGDGEQQARFFLSTILAHWLSGDRVVLDAEAAGVGAAFVRNFIGYFAGRHGHFPGLVYSYSSFLTSGKIKPSHGWGLWLAAYGSEQPNPVAGWKRLTAWQFTDKYDTDKAKKHVADGMPEPVDCSHLLDTSVIPQPAKPARKPTPKPKPVKRPKRKAASMDTFLHYLKGHVALLTIAATWALSTFPPNSTVYHVVTAVVGVLGAAGVVIVPNDIPERRAAKKAAKP